MVSVPMSVLKTLLQQTGSTVLVQDTTSKTFCHHTANYCILDYDIIN